MNLKQEILKKIKVFAKDYQEAVKAELKRLDKIATGKLVNSIKAEVKEKGNKFSIGFTSLDYYKFVDEGRRPGAARPPIKAIAEWIKVKGLNLNPFAVANSIAKKGIEPTNITKNLKKKLNTEIVKSRPALTAEINILMKKYLKQQMDQAAKNLRSIQRLR